MKTKNIGIVIDQGTPFSLVIGISDGSGPIDITGYQFLGQMRKSTDPTVTEAVAEFIFTILNQTTNKGQVQWSLDEESIEDIITSIATPLVLQRTTTPFIYDVKMKDTSGNINRIIQGIAQVSPQATQEPFP